MSSPAFSSFPDIFQSQRPARDGERSRELQGRREQRYERDGHSSRRHRADSDVEDSSRRKRREEKSQRRRIRDEAEDLLQEVLGPSNRPGLPASAFWDTAGDINIATYRDVTSRNTPRYRRMGYGTMVGLHPGLRIVHTRDRQEMGLEVAPLGRAEAERYSRKSHDHRQHRRLLLQPGIEVFDTASSFVSLGSRARQHLEDLPDYRSIGRPAESDEDDGIFSGLRTAEDNHRQQIAEIDRHVQDHPDDIDAWLRYSTFHIPFPNKSAEQTRAQAEVTLAVLARALEQQSNVLSARLHIAYLRAAEDIWSPEKVRDKWENILREMETRSGADSDFTAVFELWVAYLEWRSGPGFGKGGDEGVEAVVNDHVRCIDRIRIFARGSRSSRQQENLLHIFTRLCLFMKQAAYTERAVAAFQALLEITFYAREPAAEAFNQSGFLPENDLQAFDLILDDLEAYWEDERPRFGEEGSLGWRNTTAPVPARNPSSSQPEYKGDPFERWLQAERGAERQSLMPGRAADESSDQDPYRTVLFADVRPFLFPITDSLTKHHLIFAFLDIIGMDISSSDGRSDSPRNLDPFSTWNVTCNSTKRSAFWPSRPGRAAIAWQIIGGGAMEPEDRTTHIPFSCPVRCWQPDPTSRIGSSATWFRDVGISDVSSIDLPTVRRVLKQLIGVTNNTDLKTLTLALDSCVSLRDATRQGRSLLEKNQKDIVLWSTFARVARQPVDVSRTVFRNALQIDCTEELGETPARHQLCADWALAEFERADLDVTLEAIYAGAGLSGINRMIQLKARNYYNDVTSIDIPGQTLKALLAYLTDGVDDMCQVFSAALNDLDSNGHNSESLWQAYCHVLYLHTERHPSPASLFRQTVEKAIDRFPNNTQFLSLYLFSESRQRIDGRIQRLITRMTTGDAQISSLLWSVWAEGQLSRRTFWDDQQEGAERVRVTLSRAVLSSRGRVCLSLWRLYIEFETLQGRLESAKRLCYRAIGILGGCKELYLLPFGKPLRSAFSDRELSQLTELMLERGIRCHVPIEDFWSAADYAPEEMVNLPQDEDPEDDELGFLQERKALLPY